ncbi:MAG: hypothetical protein ACRD2O_02010 [Terriglobia bacterium]
MKLLSGAVLAMFVALTWLVALGTGRAVVGADASNGPALFAGFPRKHHKKKEGKKTKKPKNAKVESLPKQ